VRWRALPLVILVAAASVQAQPASRDLRLLANGHVRFDNGPELDMQGLRVELLKIKRTKPRLRVHLLADAAAKYNAVAAVLSEFQRSGCCDLGLAVFEKSN
jgi:biopolymer transport protein ExbD